MAKRVACLPLRGSRLVCTCQHHIPWDPWNVVLTSASTYSTFLFFLIFLNVLCNIRELLLSTVSWYTGVWFDSKPTSTPLWSFCCFPRFYQPSDNDRAVRVWDQFDSTRKVWCLRCRVQIMRRRYLTAKEETSKWWTGQIVATCECPDCDSQKVQHQAPSTEQLLYSRLVLPPYTVKIRGGRLGRIIEMSSCPTIPCN